MRAPTAAASAFVACAATLTLAQPVLDVQFRAPHEMGHRLGSLRVEPGQTLYLLTYQGEGFTKAWFDGRLYDGLDGSDFFNAVCDPDPSRCVGRIVEKPRREWWVQVRNAAGRVGWTDQPDAFIRPAIG